jgi:hypothetical protein
MGEPPLLQDDRVVRDVPALDRLCRRTVGGSPGSVSRAAPGACYLRDNSREATSEEDRVSEKKSFTAEQARSVGAQIGIDWETAPFDVEQFRMGMDVELEHGRFEEATNVTDDDPVFTGKIALAHLNEFPDYYTRLAKMEREAERGE